MKLRYKLMSAALTGVVGLVGAGFFSANAMAAYSGPARLAFFEKQTSFSATGNRIEFTSFDYRGDHKSHASDWTASDHFVCVVRSSGVPVCDGQFAHQGSLILIHGKGGEGTFDIPVVGGTGRYQGVTGNLHVHNIGTTENSDIVITLQ